jgi:membrane-bound lytic murein transglycosylase A
MRHLAVAALAAALFACAPSPEPEPEPKPEPGVMLSPAAFSDLPGWAEDGFADALAAFARSCARLATLPGDRAVGPGGIAGTAADWRTPCAAMPAADAGAAAVRGYFESYFRPWAVADRSGEAEGTVTGYYEAELTGSRKPSARYAVPIHARPSDLVTVDLGQFESGLKGRRIEGRVSDGRLVPYPARAEIEAGALGPHARPLVWVDDPVDAFFLHIQGSGRVNLPNGDTLRVGYAGTNGRPFTAIGRALIERGIVPREGMSMQAIRGWLAENPEEGRKLMRSNARYVFFRELTGDGPIGAQGVALTPGRSLAIDTGLLPLGAPMWLATSEPLPPYAPLRRLMVAQDTGSAIRGAVRADFFFGAGVDAALRAGGMNRKGRYWLLLPRAIAPPAETG